MRLAKYNLVYSSVRQLWKRTKMLSVYKHEGEIKWEKQGTDQCTAHCILSNTRSYICCKSWGTPGAVWREGGIWLIAVCLLAKAKRKTKIPTSEEELFLAQSTKSGAKATLPSTPGSLWGMDFRGDAISVNVLNTTEPSSFEKEFNVGKGGAYISPGKKS